MGKLIDPARAKRAKRAREERAARILEAAGKAFVRDPYFELTLDSIGRQAGVKQGQATLAFRSLEELYMTVLRGRLNEWYDELEAQMTASEDPLAVDEMADLVATSLTGRPDLTRMLGPLHMVLEVHEDGVQVHQFYQWQLARLTTLADATARRIAGVDRWDAFDALYRSQLVAATIHPLDRPVGNLAVDLMAEEHQVFALDMESEIARVVRECLKA